MQLTLINYKGDTLFCAPIAAGKAYGNKQNKGTCVLLKEYLKSSIFKMRQNGHMIFTTERRNRGAYRKHFIRLKVPGHKGIGIHGTHALKYRKQSDRRLYSAE